MLFLMQCMAWATRRIYFYLDGFWKEVVIWFRLKVAFIDFLESSGPNVKLLIRSNPPCESLE